MEEHHGKDFKPMHGHDKAKRYENVRDEFEGRLDSSSHPLANTSNLIALLKQEFNWWWIGFYWVRNADTPKEHLALGQFQGPAACTMLFKGTGVCAAVWTSRQPIVLEDVNKFEGHVACSSVSKSEIVIPIEVEGKIVGVLDIDGANYG